jgi:hypothetical protein
LGDVTNNKPNSKLGRKGGGSSFIGVVITKPAPSASKPKITSPVDGLAAALSRAFIQNENALTSAGMTSIPVNRVRPHQPREAKHATTARTARLALATRSITQLDIDAFLGTGTGNAALPQQGGKYGQERWEKEIVERTDTNLMFLKRDLKAILGQPCGQEDAEVHTRAYAIEAKSRTEKFVDYLEMMFGPGDIHRGWGSKPVCTQT